MSFDCNIKRVLDCIPLPMFILDTDDRFVYINKRSKAWLRSNSIRVGNNDVYYVLERLLTKEDTEKCRIALERIKQAVENKRTITIKLEVTLHGLNKSYHIILTTASNITIDKQWYVLVTLEDITHLKIRESQLSQSQSLLTQIVDDTTRIIYDNIKFIELDTLNLQQQLNLRKQYLKELEN